MGIRNGILRIAIVSASLIAPLTTHAVECPSQEAITRLAGLLSEPGSVTQPSNSRHNGLYNLTSTHPQWAIGKATPFELAELRESPILGGKAASTKMSDSPTVKIVQTTPGRFGGNLHTLRRTGPDWYSSYRFEGEAIQGDPRNLVALTSPGTGYLLGFGKVGYKEMTAPDSKELNGGIALLNQALQKQGKQPIPIRFQPSTSNDLTSKRTFIRDWAYHGKLPMEDAGPAYFHDISYHANNIVLPPEFLRHSQLRFRRVLEFIDYVNELKKTDPSLAWFNNNWEELIYAYLADLLDSGSGNFWVGYVRKFNHSLGRDQRESLVDLQENMLKLSGLTRTPDESLIRLFDLSPHPWEKSLKVETMAKTWPEWRKEENITDEQFRIMARLAKKFQLAHPSEEASKTPFLYTPAGENDPDPIKQTQGMLKQIDLRRLDLSRAAAKILSAE